jgi:hypothetical protein
LWYFVNSGPTPSLSHSTSPFFVKGFFKIGSHRTFCLGQLQAVILQISASWVARITGVSHWHLVSFFFLNMTWATQLSASSFQDHFPSALFWKGVWAYSTVVVSRVDYGLPFLPSAMAHFTSRVVSYNP